jgi:hypothetical protein
MDAVGASLIGDRTMTSLLGTVGRLVVLSATLVVIGGCRAHPTDHDVIGLQRINGDLIQHVDYEPGNLIDPPRLDIYLVHGADDRVARELWCHRLGSSVFSPDFTSVWSSDEQGGWPPPSDCGDDGPVPTFVAR